jgi:putative transposase
MLLKAHVRFSGGSSAAMRCCYPTRAIKRRTRPILGFKDFNCARVILSGIEVMHMIKKGQMKCANKTPLSAANQFYSLSS